MTMRETTTDAELTGWQWRAESGLSLERTPQGLRVRSTSSSARSLHLVRSVRAPADARSLEFAVAGQVLAGSGVGVHANVGGDELHDAPLPSENSVPVKPGVRVRFRIQVGAGAELLLERLEVRFAHDPSELLRAQVRPHHRVLVITPLYPSSANAYLCGFVHSRAREYLAAGITPLVACAHSSYRMRTTYEIDGVRVVRGDLIDLAQLLDATTYDKILLHFFDEHFGLALQRSGRNARTEIALVCHGAETLFRDLVQEIRPYFSPVQPITSETHRFWERRQRAIELFNALPNVRWVFVSQWQKDRSEALLGLRFARQDVITNFISPQLFPFREKAPEQRKRIFFVRRFNDERHYSIDVAVETVLELSTRPIFKELEFDFYGDGHLYDRLMAPLRRFPNVHLHRTFLEQSRIADAHARCGIALFPIQFDNTGVSGCEAASSGLAVLTSDLGAHREFLPAEAGLLTRHNEPREYEALIEQLANDPERFQRACRLQAEKVQRVCSWENTIGRELKLLAEPSLRPWFAKRPEPRDERLLTVLITAPEDPVRLERCLASLLRVEDPSLLEIWVTGIDDTGPAGRLAAECAAASSGVVRVLPSAPGAPDIREALERAAGRYFRLLEGGDWVDPIELTRLLRALREEDVDLVLTRGAEDRAERDTLIAERLWDNLTPGRPYGLQVLAEPDYGFRGWGPLTHASTYRTDALRPLAAGLGDGSSPLSWAVRALVGVERLRYLDLDVHRRSIAAPRRPGRFLSPDSEARERDLLDACAAVDEGTFGAACRECAVRSLLAPALREHEDLLLEAGAGTAGIEAFRQRLRPLRVASELPAAEQALKHRSLARRVARAALSRSIPYAYVEAAGGEPQLNRELLKDIAKHAMPYGVWVAAKRIKSRWRP